MPTSPTLSDQDCGTRPVATKQGLRGKLATVAVVSCLVLIGIWFRVVDLDHTPGLNGDEAWSGVQAVKFLQGEPIAWQTPSGNPLNFFFCGPLVALHAVFPPSIALLRSISVVSGLLAIGVNFWLCRRILDRTTAVVSTLLLAVLPVMISYSRFAWDSSQTPLASVLLVYAAIAIAKGAGHSWWNWLWLSLAFLAAIWVHPTNVFLLPLVVACVVPWDKPRAAGPRLVAVIVVLLAVVFAWRSATELGRFTLDLGRLFLGTTIYQFISGGVTSDAVGWSDVLTWCAAGLAVYGFAKQVEKAHDSLYPRFAAGLFISLAAFYVVAGPRGVQPHFERYAIWTIVPITLVVSRGIAWWLRPGCQYSPVALTAFLTVAGGLLFGYERLYFQVFDTTGGESHLAFRTAEMDPKQRALQHIFARNRPDRTALIVSECWWTLWPIAYLASAKDNVQVMSGREYAANAARFADCDPWFVDLQVSTFECGANGRANEALGGYVFRATDRAGRPVVVVRHEGDRAR